jgi:outer membrane receptor for Fe3+-dicitrate
MKSTLLIAVSFLLLQVAQAQKGLIKGYITDEETKAPIVGATITTPTGRTAENTDQFGQFSIPNIVPGQYQLIITHIGYKTEIISADVKENIPFTVAIELKKGRLDLSAVTVTGKKSAFNIISNLDIKLRPVNTSQDVLRIVPGLFIAQHAGGGKAEQIFLRGYDIDHGTDINISVDGLPVNMVSHAHGQGYADLHFVIPETIEKVAFDKGPYTVQKGNLATAGYVEFNTKDYLKNNQVKLEAGAFNTQRATALLKIVNIEKEDNRQQLYLASEYFTSDGYFDRPQDFHRLNLMAKYSAALKNNTQISILASTFDSKWNASGQIPERALKSGLISRFGAIDDNEGGSTARSNFSAKISKNWKNNWKTTDQVYFTHYRFSLYSDFTFFLNDADKGDMINQRESRNIYGYTTTASKSWFLGNMATTAEFGGGFRYDDVADIQLAKAPARVFDSYLQRGDVREANGFFYWNQQLDLSTKLTLNAGLRYDMFRFGYKDRLAGATDFSYQKRSIASPKITLNYQLNQSVKLYLNNGIGFHSNDTRVILNNTAKDILPRVYGTDLGAIIKASKNLIIKTAIWHLLSEQEFVYVGDEGVIEPGGRTRRMGIDLSARYEFNQWLYGDLDFNLTRARAVEAAKGENYIPLAPALTSIGGLTARLKQGFNASLRYRLIGNRPADETNSVIAKGYVLADAILSYRYRKFEFQLSAENLLNTNWREAQFDTNSRLRNETDPVSEIHFTAGTPRFLKAGASFSF